MICVNEFAAKHLSTEPQGGKDIEELSRADAGEYKRSLLPTRDDVPLAKRQMPFGTYWFGVVDHKKPFHLTSEVNLNVTFMLRVR